MTIGIVAVIAIVALGFIGSIVGIYNKLVRLGDRIDNAFSQIEGQLQRRYDLIPNLVETVKGYAAHERETFERVTELRNRCAANQGAVGEQAADEARLVDGLKRMFALAEAYPDLRADERYLALQKELVNTEDRIQAARRFYNGNVRDYNRRVEAIPSRFVAALFRFGRESYFEVEPAVRVSGPPPVARYDGATRASALD